MSLGLGWSESKKFPSEIRWCMGLWKDFRHSRNGQTERKFHFNWANYCSIDWIACYWTSHELLRCCFIHRFSHSGFDRLQHIQQLWVNWSHRWWNEKNAPTSCCLLLARSNNLQRPVNCNGRGKSAICFTGLLVLRPSTSQSRHKAQSVECA